jgi:hypothetical protein
MNDKIYGEEINRFCGPIGFGNIKILGSRTAPPPAPDVPNTGTPEGTDGTQQVAAGENMPSPEANTQ